MTVRSGLRSLVALLVAAVALVAAAANGATAAPAAVGTASAVTSTTACTPSPPPPPAPGIGTAVIRLDRGFVTTLALHGTGVHVNGLYPHKVVITESQSDRARIGLRSQPYAAENLETMAEAAYQLVAGSFTGLSTTSRALLQQLQQPVRSLDGRTVVGDATTVPSL